MRRLKRLSTALFMICVIGYFSYKVSVVTEINILFFTILVIPFITLFVGLEVSSRINQEERPDDVEVNHTPERADTGEFDYY